MLLLQILNLVLMRSLEDFQMFLSAAKAPLALESLLPRYTHYSTYCILLLLMVTGWSVHVLTLCRCARRAMSSAKSRSSSGSVKVHSLHCKPLLTPLLVSFICQSMHSVESRGDSRHPCFTPVPIWSLVIGLCCRRLAHWSLCRASWWRKLFSLGSHSGIKVSTMLACVHCRKL